MLLTFIHISKTGGTTTKRILRSSYGFRHCDDELWDKSKYKTNATSVDHCNKPNYHPLPPEQLKKVLLCYPHLQSIAGHHIKPYVDWRVIRSDIKYFTIIRDPIKRCVSEFQYLTESRESDLEFEDYVRMAGNQQTKWLAGKPNSEAAIRLINDKDIFVGLTEKFDLSMILLKELYAPTLNIGYQRLKVAKDRTIEEKIFSSSDSINMIKEVNREDLALYKYVKEKLFPLYCKRFGEGLNQKLEEYQSQQSGFNNLNIMLNKVYREIVYKPFRRFYQ